MAMYGWFSLKQRESAGSMIYRNAAGDEVEVTEVSDAAAPSSRWDDLVSVGEVTTYVRRGAVSALEGKDRIMSIDPRDLTAKIERLRRR